MHIQISYHPALNPHTPVSYRVALSMLKQCCVCTREGTKPPTMFVSLSEVLILQQYVKWTGRGVERGGSERFTMEIWGSSLIFYSLPSSPPIGSIVHRPTPSSRVSCCPKYIRIGATRESNSWPIRVSWNMNVIHFAPCFCGCGCYLVPCRETILILPVWWAYFPLSLWHELFANKCNCCCWFRGLDNSNSTGYSGSKE
jgi:hypothetical protein